MTSDRAAETPDAEVRRWAGLFDTLAPSYDQSGVPFFGPIAEGLVERLDPRPGELALDLGCGRGAATFPLAERVAPDGRVDAIDISAEMVARTAEEARRRGLGHVHPLVADAADPTVGAGLTPMSYDVAASSLVLFFLPDPAAAVERWLRMLRPGGRLGLATFRPWPPAWAEVEAVFEEHVHETNSRPPTAMPDVFASDEALAGLVADAGGARVRTETVELDVAFDDLEQWRRWSLGTAMRGLWLRTPEESHPEILRRVGEVLDRHRDADGRGVLTASIRYTLASAPG